MAHRSSSLHLFLIETNQLKFCIIDVEKGNIGVPPVGRHREATGIVTGDVACNYVYRHEDVMGAHVGRLLGRAVHVGVNLVRWEDNGHGC